MREDLRRWVQLRVVGSPIGTLCEVSHHRGVEIVDIVADVSVLDEDLVDLFGDARPERAMEVQFADVADEICAPRQPSEATSAGAPDVAMVESEPKDVIGAQ